MTDRQFKVHKNVLYLRRQYDKGRLTMGTDELPYPDETDFLRSSYLPIIAVSESGDIVYLDENPKFKYGERK